MDPDTEPVEAEPSLGAFGYEYRSTGDRIVVAVEGEIDLATAPALLAALRDAVASPASAVVADLTGVEFIEISDDVQSALDHFVDALKVMQRRTPIVDGEIAEDIG